MSNEDKIFIDPLTAFSKYGPCIILVDDRRSFLAWGIKEHTSGDYGHAMILYKNNFFASQTFSGFREIKIQEYMKPQYMLKFWRIRDLTDMDKLRIITNIKRRLSAPWYKQIFSYDFLGCFIGQFFHIPGIQNPWQVFCSEETRIDYIQPIEKAALLISQHPSPSEEDYQLKLSLDVFECIGYAWFD